MMKPRNYLAKHVKYLKSSIKMADRAREKGRTERYLPKAAWASMSAEERRATDEKKKQATRGKPVNTHVANTEVAKRAGRKARAYRATRKSSS